MSFRPRSRATSGSRLSVASFASIAERRAKKQQETGKLWQDDPDLALLFTVIGARIRDERVRRGWSQAQLAHAIGLGVSQRTVSRWETGEVSIGLVGLVGVARVFDQSPGQWLDQTLASRNVDSEVVTRIELQSFLDAISGARTRHGPLTAGSYALMDNLESYLTRVLAREAVDPEEGREYLTDIVERGQWWLAHEGTDPYAESRAAWVGLFTRLLAQLDAESVQG